MRDRELFGVHDYADLHSVLLSTRHWTGYAPINATVHNKILRMLNGVECSCPFVIKVRPRPEINRTFVLPEQVATSSLRRSTWWGPSELQWQNYRIENMPSRTKPLLVFVNTKSGPMLGHMLRRKFLRLLNPLQVGVSLYFACAD